LNGQKKQNVKFGFGFGFGFYLNSYAQISSRAASPQRPQSRESSRGGGGSGNISAAPTQPIANRQSTAAGGGGSPPQIDHSSSSLLSAEVEQLRRWKKCFKLKKLLIAKNHGNSRNYCLEFQLTPLVYFAKLYPPAPDHLKLFQGSEHFAL
jgi:hypothetical protein